MKVELQFRCCRARAGKGKFQRGTLKNQKPGSLNPKP